MKKEDNGLTRRDFQKLVSVAIVGGSLPAWWRTARAEGGKLVTDIDMNAPLLEQLQYVNASERPGEQCGNCVLYTAGEGGLGKCAVLPEGHVKESGWCLSWAKKPE